MEKVIFVGMYVITKYLQILVIYSNKDYKYVVETASSAWLSATHLQTLNQSSYQICWQAVSQKPRMHQVDHQPYNPHRHIAYFSCAASPTTPVTSHTLRALPALSRPDTSRNSRALPTSLPPRSIACSASPTALLLSKRSGRAVLLDVLRAMGRQDATYVVVLIEAWEHLWESSVL